MIEVVLDTLRPAPHYINSRKRDGEIKSLANSIKQLGLLQPILIRQLDESEGTWEIVDGHRRYAALKEIANGCADAYTVKANVVTDIDDKTATMLSLAANVERENLHPVEEYEAFAEMVRQGSAIKEIAEVFGVSQKQVKQRLALGSVIPEIRVAWRDEKIHDNLFTKFAMVSEAKQREVWDQKLDPWEMRDALNEDTVPVTSNMAKFIDLDQYKKKGGHVVSDLFSDKQWLDNFKLAQDCAIEGVMKAREQWLAEGWGWVRCDWLSDGEPAGQPYDDYDYIYPESYELETEEDKAQYQEYVDNDEEWRANNFLNTKGVPIYDKKQKAKAGVVVTESWQVHIGLVVKQQKGAEVAEVAEVEQKSEPVDKSRYSAAMIADMNTAFTEAAQVAIASQPCLAQNLLINGMIEAYQHHWESPISYMANGAHFRHDMPAADHMRATVKKCKLDKLKDFGKRMERITALSPEDRAELLAALVAVSLRGISNEHEVATLLGDTVDVSQFWTPDEEFFNRMKKPALLELLREWDVAEVSGNEKKGEMVKLCVENRGDWMPEPTRSK